MEIDHTFQNSKLTVELSSNVEVEEISLNKLNLYMEKSLCVLEDFFNEELPNCFTLEHKIEFSVTICGSERIQELNKTYRDKDKQTDVLSFPVHDDLRNSESVFNEQVICLGDIFICYEVALEQAKRFNLSFEEEFLHLYIHGLLHLCGYDHDLSGEEEEIMQEFESKLLKNVALQLT